MHKHRLALAALAALTLPAAQAFEIETPNPELKVRLDLTPKISLGHRLKSPSTALSRMDVAVDPGIINEDDGNHNFDKGLISRRADLLAEFDVSGPNFGARLSGTIWRDGIYTGRNDYRGTPLYAGGMPLGPVISTASNLAGQAPNEFLPATRRQHGRGSEILDAFAYVKGEIGGMQATLRAGKHSLQWGESLFFGQNGIANAQGPVDVAKIVSVPGWQFKEVLLPVEQVSGTLRLAEGLQLGAYYQFKWRKSKLPGVGSYFSNQDYVGGGRVNFGNAPDGSPIELPVLESADLRPKDSGQGGVQLRWSPTGGDYEFGLYAAQYHDKTPSALVFDFAGGNVHLAYASKIRTIGASVTSSIGQLNWALEGSVRFNTPLNGDPAIIGGPSPILACDTDKSTPCYPLGNTAHLQLSGIYVLQPGALWQGGALLGEIAYNRRLKIKRDIFAIGPDGSWAGVGGLDPNTTKDAFALRLLFEPSYFQVAPGLDMSVPIGLGYNFGGRSSAVGNFGGGVSKGGDWTVGLKASYQNAWNFSLTYTDYLGSAKTFTETLVAGSGSPRQLTFGQTLRDRAYVAFSASRTF
ncbi:DUF1302 family protein [Paucibacter sp. PLA-PC-4]|uniref:DUF1302 domain-containing protein n=1 Tax=Paucibacter sp. PLA-PC-4 TaxID=2993655 RepID=UPI00224997BE|nr:DUF1302 family protein [Paucibacter sp. PLA-PC-4]MCX2863352.1 DUF1302 family protein [Paucibacter sp. PLA-PC-4]